jgi:hypothetical protein
VPGVAFADDTDAWEALTGVRERPTTVLIGTGGEIVWRHDGRIETDRLAEALRTRLSPGIHRPRLLKSHLREGEPAPDFLLAGGGDGVALSLIGRPAVLLFWKESSKASLDSMALLRDELRRIGNDPLLIAIHAAGGAEAASVMGDEAVVFTPDPDGAIAAAYGVKVWPTTVFVDEFGVIASIRSGLLRDEPEDTEEMAAPSLKAD